MNLLTELKNISNLLIEVKVKDLKKQNPDLVDFIDDVSKEVENKYVQYAVLKKKKENIDKKSIVNLIKKFSEYSSEELGKAAKAGLIDSEKQADISFWNKKSFEEFKEFLDKLEDLKNLNFSALRKEKFNKKFSADKIFEDDRVVVWFPNDLEESCEIGEGKWCISSRNTEKWWIKYVFVENKTFVYLIDKLINHRIVEEAFSVLVFKENELIEVWGYSNKKNIGEKSLKDHYGEKYINKVLNKIESYVTKNSDVQKSNTDLTGADLSSVDLSDAYLEGADLRGVDLSNANLSNVDLSSADLRGVDLSDAYLSNANLSNVDLSNAYLSGANLTDANLKGADLEGADLSDANLRGADLRGADLSGANLTDANLSNVDLSSADLRGVDLSDAYLSDAYLEGADLRGVDLRGVNLTDADLSNANLAGADLSGANLTDANLKGADLEGADLEGANLEGANLTNIKIDDENREKLEKEGIL